MKLFSRSLMSFLVVIVLIIVSGCEAFFCFTLGANGQFGLFGFDMHEHYVCYRPLQRDGIWYWARSESPGCDNQGVRLTEKRNFAHDWDDLSCDCFVRYNQNEIQEDVQTYELYESDAEVKEGEGSGLHIYKGHVPGDHVNAQRYDGYLLNMSLAAAMINKEDYDNGNYQAYGSPSGAAQGQKAYYNELNKSKYVFDDFYFGTDEDVFECGEADPVISCLPYDEYGDCGTTRGIQCYNSLAPDLDLRKIHPVDEDYKSEKIYPLFTSENPNYDYIMDPNDEWDEVNGQDGRVLFALFYITPEMAKSISNKLSRIVKMSLEYQGGDRRDNPNYYQLLEYNADGEITANSVNKPDIRLCDSKGRGHHFILQFKLPKAGDYELKMVVVGEQFKANGGVYTKQVVVGSNDFYQENIGPSFPVASSSSNRKLILNILPDPRSNVKSLNEITAGPYGSFEKNLEDAFSNKRLEGIHVKSNSVPDDFDFEINACPSSGVSKYIDQDGNLKLSRSDIDNIRNRMLFLGNPGNKPDWDDYVDEFSVNRAINEACKRMFMEYYDGCNAVPDLFSLDFNQVVLARIKGIKVYDDIYTGFPLSNYNEIINDWSKLRGTARPQADFIYNKNGQDEIHRSIDDILEIQRRSVVLVLDGDYRDPSSSYFLENVGLIPDEELIDFAMSYESAHELLHAWAQPYIMNIESGEEDGAKLHGSYVTGYDEFDNILIYDNDLEQSIRDAKENGLIMSESIQQIIMNQLVRKQ